MHLNWKYIRGWTQKMFHFNLWRYYLLFELKLKRAKNLSHSKYAAVGNKPVQRSEQSPPQPGGPNFDFNFLSVPAWFLCDTSHVPKTHTQVARGVPHPLPRDSYARLQPPLWPWEQDEWRQKTDGWMDKKGSQKYFPLKTKRNESRRAAHLTRSLSSSLQVQNLIERQKWHGVSFTY